MRSIDIMTWVESDSQVWYGFAKGDGGCGILRETADVIFDAQRDAARSRTVTQVAQPIDFGCHVTADRCGGDGDASDRKHLGQFADCLKLPAVFRGVLGRDSDVQCDGAETGP